MLDNRQTLPAQVKMIRQLRDRQTLLEVTLTEGRNRQIRRVAESLGYPVTALHRIKIGSLSLGNLPRGRYRLLGNDEVIRLRQDAGISALEPTESPIC